MIRVDATTQKNFKTEKQIKSNEAWHKLAMNEQNARAQKKLYNK